MHFVGQLVLAFALLAALVAASPELSKRRVTFSVKQVQRKVHAKPHAGYNALRKAMVKYGHKAPALKKATPGKKLATTNAKDAGPNDSTEKATPDDQDTQYVCEVSVAGSKYRLNFDTGSSDL